MKIIDVKLGRISVPLKSPFKTALRVVDSVEDIIVEIHTDDGSVGFGEAPPTAVITGDTTDSILGAIKDYIKKAIIGMDVANIEEIMFKVNKSMVGNSSAKAAVDMAIYDLYGKLYKAPLYRLLGGYRKEITTDITISVDEPEKMAKDSKEAVQKGYDVLKVKLGKNSDRDIDRIRAIRDAVGYDVKIRLDANQGWSPREAVRILRKIEDEDFCIELVEQPVPGRDIEGLKYVTDHVDIPVLADESVFSPMDAIKIMQMRAADLINIKLMKTGGIYNALKICAAAEVYGVECMIGCMLEAKVSVTAAVHLAAAKKIITKVDLDGPLLCSEDPVKGGAIFNEKDITLTDDSGLGIEEVEGIKYIY